MKKLGVALAMTIAAVGAAHAADLPTKKEAPPPPPVNCFSSLLDLHQFNRRGLPAQLWSLHLYVTLDWGSNTSPTARPGARRNQRVGEFCQQAGARIQVAVVAEQPQPVGRRHQDEPAASILVGLLVRVVARRHGGNRISDPIPGIWPTAHAPRSRTTARRRSCRASTRIRAATANGIIRRALSGISNPAYGTLVWGRVNTLGLDSSSPTM